MNEVLHITYARILAIDLCRTGFGFVVLEGNRRLLDWGVAKLSSGRKHEFLVRIDRLVARYTPSLVAAEEIKPGGQRRRAHMLIACLQDYLRDERINFETVTRTDVRQSFEEVGRNKRDIAVALAGEFPELELRVAPPRKIWLPEEDQMNIFDALSFVYALPEARRRRGR